jgi:transcriptional regulator with XRE-family HTH domain
MPANERLRAAILRSGRSLDQLAHDLGVDPKTIERWIAGRIPYKSHQYALADLLSADPAYLWPTGSPAEASGLAMAEILAGLSDPLDGW